MIGVTGAAIAPGMSKVGMKKIAAVGMTATKSIAAVDSNALKEISEIYEENELSMPQPVVAETKVGVLTVPLAVTGAAAAASAASMNEADVARVAVIENAAKREITTIDEAAGDELEAIHAKEGLTFTRPAGAAAAAGILGAGAVGATIAGALSKASQIKVGTASQLAETQIAGIDAKAVSNVAAIYRENNLTMETPSPTTTQVGFIAAPLGIIGAGALAAKSKMGSIDIARIANVEKSAVEDIKSIDQKAVDEIAAINEKEGVWFERPGGSRAASAAAAAGLDIVAVKKVAAAEESAALKMDSFDSTAAADVAAASKKHASFMRTCAKKTMTLEAWDAEEAAAAKRYAKIEAKVLDKIDSVDRSTERDVAAIYAENGKTPQNPDGEKGYFTARGAAGATATAAAITMASNLAAQRRSNLGNLSRSTPPPAAASEDGILHFGIYDLGAGVASVGKAITGFDLEGPAEYDARSHWTPEQRARTCCA